MTKRLILIRHAESSWAEPFDDHSRTLNDRGRTSAKAIGTFLEMNNYNPDVIYCSDSARTIETTKHMNAKMRTVPKIYYLDKLYNGSLTALWKVLHNSEGNVVALVAHNPSIALFAEDVVDKAPNHPRFSDYPSCATLVCDFPTNDWAEAVASSGQVRDFIVPTGLEQ